MRERVRGAMARALVRSDEEIAIAEVICTLVGIELVRDGDTVQIGTGAISAALAPYLTHRHELGVQQEGPASGEGHRHRHRPHRTGGAGPHRRQPVVRAV